MGYYDSSIAIATFFASVLFLDIGSGIMRFMMDQERSDKNYAIYSGLAIFLSSLILYIVISVIFRFFYQLPLLYLDSFCMAFFSVLALFMDMSQGAGVITVFTRRRASSTLLFK